VASRSYLSIGERTSIKEIGTLAPILVFKARPNHVGASTTYIMMIHDDFFILKFTTKLLLPGEPLPVLELYRYLSGKRFS